LGTSKLETSGVPARPAVTSALQVPDDGSVAPVADTWSAVTGVTGNLRAGSTEVGGRDLVASTASGHPSPACSAGGGYAVQSGRRPNAVMSRSWGSSGISTGGRSAMAPALR